MIRKMKMLQRIVDTGIIAIVRADSPDKAIRIAEAIREGGVDIIEITLTVPGAIRVIEELNRVYGDGELLIGAGSVLDPETARAAILVGAEYIVGPNLNPLVAQLCNRYQKIYMPGCMTVTEIVRALEMGVDMVKVFPGGILGPSMIKAVKGPLPQAELVPTGGVDLNNVQDWIQSGCIAVGVGSELTKGANTGDYELVKATARQFVEKIRAARSQGNGVRQ